MTKRHLSLSALLLTAAATTMSLQAKVNVTNPADGKVAIANGNVAG